jgi:RHS repeat-associated protein
MYDCSYPQVLFAYKFTGKERDSETGLDKMGRRYYSNAMGRFTSPDPLIIQKQKLLDPQQWNMYQYARDNPLRFTDPTGLYVCNGNSDQCGKIRNALSNVQKAADMLAKNEEGHIFAFCIWQGHPVFLLCRGKVEIGRGCALRNSTSLPGGNADVGIDAPMPHPALPRQATIPREVSSSLRRFPTLPHQLQNANGLLPKWRSCIGCYTRFESSSLTVWRPIR